MDINGKRPPPSWAGLDPRIADARVEKAGYAAGQPMAVLTMGNVQESANLVEEHAQQVRAVTESLHQLLFGEPTPTENPRGELAATDSSLGLLRVKRTLIAADDALCTALRVLESMHGRVSQ